jgi:ABC-type multidrug transport system ATPase subunit
VNVLGHELPRHASALRPRIGMLAHEPLLYRDLTPRENLSF